MRQETVGGPYRIQLVIGPVATNVDTRSKAMRDMAGVGGTCRVGGRNQPNRPSAGLAAGEVKVCNHHLELLISNRRTGQAVKRARVTVSIVDAVRHTVSYVPIIAPVGTHLAPRNQAYGSNIYVLPGKYLVKVTVNGTAVAFTVQLS